MLIGYLHHDHPPVRALSRRSEWQSQLPRLQNMTPIQSVPKPLPRSVIHHQPLIDPTPNSNQVASQRYAKLLRSQQLSLVRKNPLCQSMYRWRVDQTQYDEEQRGERGAIITEISDLLEYLSTGTQSLTLFPTSLGPQTSITPLPGNPSINPSNPSTPNPSQWRSFIFSASSKNASAASVVNRPASASIHVSWRMVNVENVKRRQEGDVKMCFCIIEGGVKAI